MLLLYFFTRKGEKYFGHYQGGRIKIMVKRIGFSLMFPFKFKLIAMSFACIYESGVFILA